MERIGNLFSLSIIQVSLRSLFITKFQKYTTACAKLKSSFFEDLGMWGCCAYIVCYCLVPAYFIVPKPLTISKNSQQRPGYEAGDLLNDYVFVYNEDVKYLNLQVCLFEQHKKSFSPRKPRGKKCHASKMWCVYLQLNTKRRKLILESKFICSRIKKRRKPRVKIVTLESGIIFIFFPLLENTTAEPL